jgi:uncharacterized repeat protein (TIGR01451 family)
VRVLLFLGCFLSATAAFAHDLALTIAGPEHVVAGSFAAYRIAINGEGVPPDQRITGRLVVPPQLIPYSVSNWDPVTRVVTWTDYLAGGYQSSSSNEPVFRVDPALKDGATLTLQASFTSTMPDTNAANDSASLTAVASASADVELKTTTSVASLTPGSELGYTLTVTNLGALDAHKVVLSDNTASITRFLSFMETSGPAASILTPLFGGYGTAIARMDTLHAGESATFQLLVRVDPTVETYVLTNQPVIESETGDPNGGNNTNLVFVFVGPDADLKVASRAPDTRETRFPITVDVGNDGPQTVKSVDVDLVIEGDLAKVNYLSITPSQGTCTEPVIYTLIASPSPPPAWRVQCALGTLVPGATATITAIVDTKPVKTMFTHIASVTAYNDPNRANNASNLALSNYSKGRARAVRK